MKWIFLIFFFFGVFHTFLLTLLKNLSTSLHQTCEVMSPLTNWKFAYQAIVCGSSLAPGDFKKSLITTGLIHLIVVSGSHLIFLSHWTEKICQSRRVVWMILFLFTLTTGLQPPTVRAFVSLLLFQFVNHKKLFWTQPQRTIVSGLITLTLFPAWVTSVSFIMSWAASFSLATNPFKPHQLRYHFYVFLILYPIFLPLAPLNPISIAANLVFSSFIGAVIFPISLMAFLHSGFAVCADFFWIALDWTLQKLAVYAPESQAHFTVPFYFLWGYLFALHIWAHMRHNLQRRKKYV